MKAVVCKAFGPPEQLVIEERDDPVAGSGQLLVEIKAAAITYVDALFIEDKYQFSMPLPYVPGGEVAGIVREVGDAVSDFAVGDAVVGNGLGGGFAELALVNAADARRLPPASDHGEAIGMLYAYGTGVFALEYRAQLKADETLLVLGAGGSVGLAAMELAKLMGARVIAAASSPEKLALCRESGADETIDYSREDLKTRTKELTAGRGADVVYDLVGGPNSEQALRATAWKGRFLVLGFAAGIPSVPLNLTLLKGCQIVGVFFGDLPRQEPETMDAVVKRVKALLAAGKIRSRVSRRYSLEEVPQVLRDFNERRIVGKVVIVP
jgi:NADPH2:quinone reductase